MTEAEIDAGNETVEAGGNVVPLAANELPASEAQRPDPVGAATQFVKDHPYLVVAGGLALGAIAASFLPKGTGRRMVRRAATLAEAASAASLLLGKTAWSRAEHAGHDLRDIGSAGADRVSDLLGTASSAASRTGQRIAEKASELKHRVKR